MPSSPAILHVALASLLISTVYCTFPYYCESHDSDGNYVFPVTREPTYITSAGYYRRLQPRYRPFQLCRWVVRASETGAVVKLDIEDLQLEPDDHCAYDYLEIRAGDGPDSEVLARLCGRKDENREIVSSGRDMVIVFNSDYSNQFRGFKLRLTSICNRPAQSAVGVMVASVVGAVCLVLLLVGSCWVCALKNKPRRCSKVVPLPSFFPPPYNVAVLSKNMFVRKVGASTTVPLASRPREPFRPDVQEPSAPEVPLPAYDGISNLPKIPETPPPSYAVSMTTGYDARDGLTPIMSPPPPYERY